MWERGRASGGTTGCEWRGACGTKRTGQREGAACGCRAGLRVRTRGPIVLPAAAAAARAAVPPNARQGAMTALGPKRLLDTARRVPSPVHPQTWAW